MNSDKELYQKVGGAAQFGVTVCGLHSESCQKVEVGHSLVSLCVDCIQSHARRLGWGTVWCHCVWTAFRVMPEGWGAAQFGVTVCGLHSKSC